MIFFFVFFNMGPFARKIEKKKKILLPQRWIATKSFQTFPEFLSSTSSQSYFFTVLIFLYFFKFYETLKFNMESRWEIIKYGISGKWLIIDRNWWKFVTRAPRNSICRVLFGSGHFTSFWGHSLLFAKFPIFRFQKVAAPAVLIQLQPNFVESMENMVEYGLLPFLAICQKLKTPWHFNFLLTQDHMGLNFT